MWQKVFQYFLRRFQMANGRSPMTAAEMNQIQSEAVNWINKTGGKTLPGTPQSQKPPFQGFTPRVIEGGKGKAGIGTLLKIHQKQLQKLKLKTKQQLNDLKLKRKHHQKIWHPAASQDLCIFMMEVELIMIKEECLEEAF